LVLAAYSNDILKLGFKATGLETSGEWFRDVQEHIYLFIPAHMPWSHGLFMSLVWAFLAAILVYLVYKDRRSALVIGLVVASHWFLDFIVHPPELSLFFNISQLYGLGLWVTDTGLRIAMMLELNMIIIGIGLYLFTRKNNPLTSSQP
jgi:membrane-bound metal-dependent hydrolase YbcI (DUF457 family)